MARNLVSLGFMFDQNRDMDIQFHNKDVKLSISKDKIDSIIDEVKRRCLYLNKN